MNKKQVELEIARRLWDKLCEIESKLFVFYGEKFIDMHMIVPRNKIRMTTGSLIL